MSANSAAENAIRGLLAATLTGIGIGIGFLIVDKTLRKEELTIEQVPPPAGYRRGGRGRSEEEEE